MATRILYVITKANFGGAQRYVYDLAVAAHEKGFDVSVAYGTPGILVDRLLAAHIRTIPIENLARDVSVLKELTAFRELLRLFKQERPDIVHLNSAKAGGLGALAARLAGVPHIVFTAHGWAFNEQRPGWQKALIRMLSGVTVTLAHTTLCVSEATRRDIRWVPFSKKKLTVIHNGITCAPQKDRIEARAKLLPGHDERFWIGMLSELHPTKRVIDAIIAMQSLVQTHPNVVLVILGEGEERIRLEKEVAARGLEKHVFLIGFVADGPSYLQAFDLFLHASLSEALGYVILEAGCANLPVVATRVGGVPEIIENGQNGLLVPPRQPLALAQAVLSLMDAPLIRARLADTLHDTVLQHFSKEAMSAETFAAYGR
jgi:glycosyltransferase involved in cell wall biosynthesis